MHTINRGVEALAGAFEAFRAATGRPPTILVDMDAVLCQWEEGFVAHHRRLFPDVPTVDAGQRFDFDLFAGLDDAQLEATLAIMNLEGFYTTLEPMPGGIEAVNTLIAAGGDVVICTSPWQGNPTCASDKLAWVTKHLGDEMWARTIIARDKTRVAGDLLIDDKPHVKGAATPLWEHIRYTQPYNARLDVPRLTWTSPDWADVIIDALERRVSREQTA